MKGEEGMNRREEGFRPDEIEALSPEGKIALICTTDSVGRPHLSMLSSLMALSPRSMAMGEFSVGRSKAYMQQRPDVGFFVMTLDRRIWRGSATWTGLATEGPEYRMFNEKPMFRYNSYFGINTVHYFDLLHLDEAGSLPLLPVATGMALSLPLRLPGLLGRGGAMNSWTHRFLARPDVLKFVGFVGADGLPCLVPALQSTPWGSSHMVFPEVPWSKELRGIPEGASVALFGLSMKMEMVLVRGSYQRRKLLGPGLGTIAVDWVYNPMPPCHGQIYPPLPLEPVTVFE